MNTSGIAELHRVEILVSGRVQGVGFRYFVVREAEKRGIVGQTTNRVTGEVLTIAEGNKRQLEEFYAALQEGPTLAQVERHNCVWSEATGEFEQFTIAG